MNDPQIEWMSRNLLSLPEEDRKRTLATLSGPTRRKVEAALKKLKETAEKAKS